MLHFSFTSYVRVDFGPHSTVWMAREDFMSAQLTQY